MPPSYAGGLFAWHQHVSQIKAMVSVEPARGEYSRMGSVDGHSWYLLRCPASAPLATASSGHRSPMGCLPSHGDSLPTVVDPASTVTEVATSESCLSKRQWSSSSWATEHPIWLSCPRRQQPDGVLLPKSGELRLAQPDTAIGWHPSCPTCGPWGAMASLKPPGETASKGVHRPQPAQTPK